MKGVTTHVFGAIVVLRVVSAFLAIYLTSAFSSSRVYELTVLGIGALCGAAAGVPFWLQASKTQ